MLNFKAIRTSIGVGIQAVLIIQKGHTLYGGKWLPYQRINTWHPDTKLEQFFELLDEYNKKAKAKIIMNYSNGTWIISGKPIKKKWGARTKHLPKHGCLAILERLSK